MELFAAAWDYVTVDTIQNCWNHTGLVNGRQAAKMAGIVFPAASQATVQQQQAALREIEEKLKRLKTSGQQAASDMMQAAEWVRIDDHEVFRMTDFYSAISILV
jgi:small-conductance mechanosensitive channel